MIATAITTSEVQIYHVHADYVRILTIIEAARLFTGYCFCTKFHKNQSTGLKVVKEGQMN